MQRARPTVERWRADWIRSGYLQQLPHLRPDTEIGEGGWIIGGERVHFGADVRIGRRARLQTISRSATGQLFDPSIRFGDGASMEDGCHVGAIGHVDIGANVLIASHVLVLDHSHGYADPDVPVSGQDLEGGGLVIGPGTHVGEQACLLGTLTIGAHCVIGAGAVVISDVPDGTVVGGVPARPLRRYDAARRQWQRV
jgi:acetyltransferase-like isoleucine patch superfamily enzyme